jgi:hypothetical protein
MKYLRENIETEVFQMAKAAGHEILYSPPNLSYLSPIETVWANIKGDIGREYTDETTTKDVEERLLRAFNNVKSKQVAGVIKKTNGHIYELLMEIMEEDNADDYATLVGNGSDEEDDDDDLEDNDDVDEQIVDGVLHDPSMDAILDDDDSDEEDDNMEDNDDRNAQIVNVVVLDDPLAEIILDDNGTDEEAIHEIPLQDDA